VSKNFSGGRHASKAAIQNERDAMDALPLALKAALWDAMQPWDAAHVSDVLRRHGARKAIAIIAGWDREEIAARRLWLAKHERRVGQRTADMKPSPHQAAGATQVRSHARLYCEGRAS
jgi:hypothetical protein